MAITKGGGQLRVAITHKFPSLAVKRSHTHKTNLQPWKYATTISLRKIFWLQFHLQLVEVEWAKFSRLFFLRDRAVFQESATFNSL